MKPLVTKDRCHAFVYLVFPAFFSCMKMETVLAFEKPTVILEAGIPMATDFPIANRVAESLQVVPTDNPIGSILLSKHHPLLLRSDFSRDSEVVTRVYQDSNFQPIWLTANRSEKNLRDLLGILREAPSDALNPVNYDVELLENILASRNLDGDMASGYDVALTVSLVRFLHDLRHGRVDPQNIQIPVYIPPKPYLDLPGLLKQQMAEQTLPNMVALFEPKAKQYRQLKQILNRMRQFNGQIVAEEVERNKILRPGGRHPMMAILRQCLQVAGLVAANSDADELIYDGALVAAVKKIQQRYGMKADGVFGPNTTEVFNKFLQEKTALIQLGMERARWIPETTDGPMIVVNIPAFELWAFSSQDDRKPLNMKVIVGKAPDRQTPVLWEEMKYLEFMPYWNIPNTILHKEILPKLAKKGGDLASQDIEWIRHQNSEEHGGGSYLRARQRPGKNNPLGRVKFVFPNTADVYLHDTPSHAAFNRLRRDLSHGCVRVSEPEQLAEFVLGNQQGWDKETIKQAMSGSKNRHVTLKRAVPVLFYYGTTFVDYQNQLRFYPDVYGQDERLKSVLSKI